MSWVIDEILQQRAQVMETHKGRGYSVEMNKKELKELATWFKETQQPTWRQIDWKSMIGGRIYGLKIIHNEKVEILNVH